jgi:hypothetical protein
MLTRRTLLGGGVGVLTTSACLSQDRGEVDPMSFGAVGDGVANDTEAVKRALRSSVERGLPLNGGEKIFAVSDALRVERATRPWIRSLRLKQTAPVNGMVTLRFVDCQGVRIDRLEVNLGIAASVGDCNSSFGLWVYGGSNHRVANVTAFGHGKNSLIAIWNTTGSVYEDLTVRDAIFDDPSATDDVMQGIWLYRNTDCVVRRPVVSNLQGNASYAGVRFPNLRTRGIALNGNARVTVADAVVSNVDQGIDFTGQDGNLSCRVTGGRTFQCTSVGVKLSNSAVDCSVSGHIAERIGMYAFMASGPSGPGMHHKTRDCDFTDCTALDVGYNRIAHPTTAGFHVHHGDADFDYPMGIRFIRCHARDRQQVRTMKYGFFTDVIPKPEGARRNATIACTSSGHLIAAREGRWSVS